MKLPVNFRLSQHTIALLGLLTKRLHVSKTDILEQAIAHFAKKQLTKQAGFLQLAGSLDAEQADDMLKTIHQSRKSKRKAIDL